LHFCILLEHIYGTFLGHKCMHFQGFFEHDVPSPITKPYKVKHARFYTYDLSHVKFIIYLQTHFK